MQTTSTLQRPPWLKRRISISSSADTLENMLRASRLHSVCEEADCPNRMECFASGTATFLILGNRCTRNCRFCAVRHGPIEAPDADEPQHVAEAAKRLGLTYVVITSVTRDDLPDGGAEHFAKTICEIRQQIPEARIEVLIPDFRGNYQAILQVVNARPDVINHNIETVPRIYSKARQGADFNRSLFLLRTVKDIDPNLPTKSGIMLGLGETRREVRRTMLELKRTGCNLVTIGQYLQPGPGHIPVHKYIEPPTFEGWEKELLRLGFDGVASGTFVRSSYNASVLLDKLGRGTGRS